ncbi:hypothetical protein ANCCAN_08204 [Ancylostoma caninum]|uniref:Uncharacterized protein n=1 Tax=Ancylostoma caninum TaxID=29170 RepID=A0A368GN50_ANCCA|nr:hypothetical protein ANCCAN_08204 [Ancylostoma caninum]
MGNQWRKVGIEGVRSWRHGNDGHEIEPPADHLQQLALVLHENKMLLMLLPFFRAAAAQGEIISQRGSDHVLIVKVLLVVTCYEITMQREREAVALFKHARVMRRSADDPFNVGFE